MKSIRKTLILSIVGGLFALTIVSGILCYIWARHSLTNQLDTILAAKARALANLVEDDAGNIYFEFSDDNMPEFVSRESHHFFQVWLPDGAILSRSQSLGTQNLPQLYGTIEEPDAISTHLPDGLHVRLVGFQFDPIKEVDEVRFVAPPSPHKASIVVGRVTMELEAQLRKLFWIFFSLALLLPAVSAIIISIAVKRGLKPLDDLAEKVGGINVSSLQTHITEGENIAELQPITQGLNGLLHRLHTAFERERRFTMDASHELRTPLAEIRTALEIALKWPDDRDLLLNSAGQALDATHQMEAMVGALLSLARAESDNIEGPMEIISLVEILQHCWGQLGEQVASRNLALSMDKNISDNAYINKTLARAIIINLLTNAVQYSTSGTTIECSLSATQSDNQALLRISNAMAVPLSAEDVERIFEPLWRKDKSRTEDKLAQQAHFGLGLTLVRTYCEKLGVPLQVSVDGERFIIELKFFRYASTVKQA